MKKTILFQLNQLGYGGTEKAIHTFIKNIDKNKFNIKVFFYTDVLTFSYYRRKILSFFINKYKKQYVHKYITNFSRKDDFIKLVGEDNFYLGTSDVFFNIFKKSKIDIVHFNRGVEEDFYTNRINEIPKEVLICETNIFGKESNLLYMKRLSIIFFVSKWLITKENWTSKYKSVPLYNPICLPKSELTLRKKYNIDSSQIILGRISRPNLDDGDFLINVLEKVLSENVYFMVIGSSDKFKVKVKNIKNIICIEPTINEIFLSKFYNTIDILLHYRIEGETFGMNIAEAMIHGKPVVSHKSSIDNAQEELLLEEYCSGIVVEEDNLNMYVNAVNKLIKNKNLRSEYGENAKLKSRNLYAEDSVTSSLENYYEELN